MPDKYSFGNLNPILNRVGLGDDISLNGSTIYYTELVPYPYDHPNDEIELLSTNYRYTGFRLQSPVKRDDGIDMNFSDSRVGVSSLSDSTPIDVSVNNNSLVIIDDSDEGQELD